MQEAEKFHSAKRMSCVVSSRKMAQVKKVCFTAGENSTFDGLAKILRTDRLPMKLFWSVVLLFLLSACAYVFIQSILDYFKYEVVTTITVRQEMPAKMPAVIVCNSNGLMTPTAVYFASQVYNVYGVNNSNEYLHFYIGQIAFPRILNNKGNVLLPRTMVMSAARNPLLDDAFRQSLGLTIQDMLFSCTFNSAECTAQNFNWQFDTYYGNCYKFSPNSTY